jgi:hypothetical protein
MVNVRGRQNQDRSQRSGYVYRPRSVEDVKARAERTGGRFDSPFKQGIDLWRPKAGDNLIRILPPTWEDADHYAYTAWMHKWIGPDNSNYLCPRKMLGKACAVCDAAREAKDAGEKDEEKALNPSEALLTWILDRDADDPAHPYLYQMSWTMDRDIAALCYNKRSGKILNIDDPDDGYDLTLKRSGTGLKTKYFGLAIDRDPSPITDDPKEYDEIMEYIQENQIPDILKFYDNDYLIRVLEGTQQAKDPDLDKEDRGGRSKRGEDEEDAREHFSRTRRGREEPAEEPEDRSTRRSRRDEAPEEPERPSRGRRAAEPEEESPRGSRGSRRSGSEDEEAPDEDVRPTQRSRDTEDRPERPTRSGDTTREDRGSRRSRDPIDEAHERVGKKLDDKLDEVRGRRNRDGDAYEDARPTSRRRSSDEAGGDDPPFEPDEPEVRPSRSRREEPAPRERETRPMRRERR